MELDVGELRDPVDGQEHDQLAVGVTQFATVDVDVADLVGLEPLAVLLCLLRRKPGDAMALQAPVQGAAAEIGDGVLQATKHIVQGQQSLLPERYHDGFLGRRQHRALRRLRDPWARPPSWSACAICTPSSRSGPSGRQGRGRCLSTLGARLEYAASCGLAEASY